MGDIIVDGTVRVSFVPTIANKAAPTVAELNAGTLLQTVITADGLVGYEPETAEVATDALSSTFDTKGPGRASFSGTLLRLKKQTTGDTAYDTMLRGIEGYIAIRRYMAQATAWASGQKVGIYPVACGELREMAPEANTVARFEIPTMIREEPNLRAVVA